MAEVLQFNNIVHGARGTSAHGTFIVNDNGISWKKAGGLAPQLWKKDHISDLVWSLVPAGGLLRVRQHDKGTAQFSKFSKSEEEALRAAASKKLGKDLRNEDAAVKGHNWGRLSVHGASVAFTDDEGRHIFELPLSEVGEVQGGKEDAILEFNVDDGTLGPGEDALCSVTFSIPDENRDFTVDEEEGGTAADAFKLAITDKTDTLAGEGDAIAEFAGVQCLYPRGRYDLAFYPAFLDMDGQNHQFKIRYGNIDRVYLLPRPAPPGTLLLVHLENAIRRGQTYYEWVALFFDDAAGPEAITLSTDDAFLAKKNEENKANMAGNMTGTRDTLVNRLLRGFSGAKVTKHSVFLAADGVSPYVAATYKNDAGTLYPLERGLLYTFKPEFVPFEHVESVEFERQGDTLHVAQRTFDLSVKVRADAPTRSKRFLYRSIHKDEWMPLLQFFERKGVVIVDAARARLGPSAASVVGGASTAAAAAAAMEADVISDESDDEFAGNGADEDEEEDADAAFSGSGTSDSGSESDAELIPEEGISVEAIGGKSKKRSRSGKAPGDTADAAANDDDDDDDDDEGKGGGKEGEDDGDEEEGGGGSGEAAGGGGGGSGGAAGGDEDEEDEEEEKPKKKAAKKEKAPPKKRKGKKDEEEKEKGGKKKKAKKDPNAPKRNLTAYLLFSNAKREEVKAAHPGIEFTAIPKKLAEMWKALKPEEKKPYDEQSARDKERYQKQLAEYKAKLEVAAGEDEDE